MAARAVARTTGQGQGPNSCKVPFGVQLALPSQMQPSQLDLMVEGTVTVPAPSKTTAGKRQDLFYPPAVRETIHDRTNLGNPALLYPHATT